MNQLMVQADGGGSRLCGVEGGSLVEVWRGGKVQVDCGGRPFGKRARPFGKRVRPFGKRARPFGKRTRPFGKRARPFGERGALVACLVGGLVISSFSFMQLRVDNN
jgi:hypothetical protein